MNGTSLDQVSWQLFVLGLVIIGLFLWTGIILIVIDYKVTKLIESLNQRDDTQTN